MKEKGQVVVLLLLVMVIALAIGLSMIGRSVLEVSTSRKSEDSSRAFSAAEAGIEQVIQANLNNLGGTPVNVVISPFQNQAGANITLPTESLPFANTALEYPPFGKESFAQFWLASPDNISVSSYNQSSFDIYFGDPDIGKKKYVAVNGGHPDDQPAIEVNVIYWDGTKYQSFRKYFDSFAGALSSRPDISNGFLPCDTQSPPAILTNNNTTSTFYCRVNVTGYPNIGSNVPVMARIRLLYTNISHPVALQPLLGGSLPRQVNIYQSKGTSGNVQRTLEVFHQKAVMPQIFDYVLFSANNLQK